MNSKVDLLQENDLTEAADILFCCYPEVDNLEEWEKYLSNSLKTDSHMKYYKISRKNKVAGVMRFFDFEMNIRNIKTKASGLGLVGVSPLARKAGVAKEMMQFFLADNYRLGLNFLILYPFSMKVYKNMGFGYGTKQRMYKLLPTSIPNHKRDNLEILTSDDVEEFSSCYKKYSNKTNGIINRRETTIKKILANPANRIVAHKVNNQIDGYIIFNYKKEKFDYEYDCVLVVSEFVYNTKDALTSLLGFLHSQKDQAIRIHIETQDEYLFYLFDEPMNGEKETFKTEQLECYTTALSMMYRIINIKGLFREYKGFQFGTDTFKLKLTIKDTFLKDNNGSTVIRFSNGYSEVRDDMDDFDVELKMDICDFSSLFVGAVPLSSLLKYGLAEISDKKYTNIVANALNYPEKPICLTGF